MIKQSNFDHSVTLGDGAAITWPNGQCVLTCVGSLVNFQILASGKHFAAARKRTWKGLLASMDPDVVDQFVFGLEWFAGPWTVEPEAGMIADLRAAHVLDSDMGDNLVHRAEHLVTGGRLATAAGTARTATSTAADTAGRNTTMQSGLMVVM